MKESLLNRFNGDLAFIENPENYYAMFKYVIDKCASAQLGNILLYEDGHFTDGEYTCNVSRIQRAKERAITTHGEWTVKAFERSKTQHTPRTFVSSVYSDIWGIEITGEITPHEGDATATRRGEESTRKLILYLLNEGGADYCRKCVHLNKPSCGRYVSPTDYSAKCSDDYCIDGLIKYFEQSMR